MYYYKDHAEAFGAGRKQGHEDMLRHRGVETPCEKCAGFGCYVYGSGATWRGGIGTASPCRDVCDSCWGSGNADAAWTDLRRLRDEEAGRVAAAAGELLAQRAGMWLNVMTPAIEALCDELARLQRGRKARPSFFVEACAAVVRTLREAVAARRARP